MLLIMPFLFTTRFVINLQRSRPSDIPPVGLFFHLDARYDRGPKLDEVD